jgi:precorrin-6B methylase 2
LSGCKRADSGSNRQELTEKSVVLNLTLPEHFEYLDRDPPRVTKLTVDGVEQPKPQGQTARVVIQPDKDQKEIRIVFSFWPVTYSNTIRTHVVPVKRGETLEVDFTKEDPKYLDHYVPIYFQTPQAVVQAMLKLAEVGPKDVVMDIGCGDGRAVITAVKELKAKRGIGIDIRGELVELSRVNARKALVSDRTEFLEQDALKIKDLSHVNVVFLYLGEDLSARLQPVLQKTLPRGARVVSLDFGIGDWEPDYFESLTEKNNYGKDQEYTLYLWQIP